MTGYSTYWRTTILAAIAFHLLTALGFSYVLPHLTPKPKIETAEEFEWIDVDLSDEIVVDETQAIPTESVQEIPTFNAQDLFVPQLTTPETSAAEKIPSPPPPPELKPVERPQPKPPSSVTNKPPVNSQPPVQQKVDEPPKDEVIVPANGSELVQPPVKLTEVYPESGLGYKGYISFAARIGKDGKVKTAEVIQSSGRLFVDEIARKAAMQWTFRPALDKFNRPMECDAIITFNFKKIS